MSVIRSLFNDWVGARLQRSAFLLAYVALLPFTVLMAVISTSIKGRLMLNEVHGVPVPWDMVFMAGLLSVPVHLAELNIISKRALDIGFPPDRTAVLVVAGPAIMGVIGLGDVGVMFAFIAFMGLVLLPSNAAGRRTT